MAAYVGLGSNLGDKRANIALAVRMLGEKAGKVVCLSSFYDTDPWGFESQNRFVNAALRIDTMLTPAALLATAKEIERTMGRMQKTHGGVYRDRTIDIDILLIEGVAINTPELTIPHPLMHMREFVLRPLAEIAPDLVVPATGKTVSSSLALLG